MDLASVPEVRLEIASNLSGLPAAGLEGLASSSLAPFAARPHRSHNCALVPMSASRRRYCDVGRLFSRLQFC